MAGNIKIGSNGSSGTTTFRSNESTDRTIDLPDATDTLIGRSTTDVMTNKTLTLTAGTNSVAPLTYASGTNLTAASAGATEFDGTVFYSTPVASARGLSPSTMYSIVPSGDFSLLTTSGVQSAFPTTGDVWTLAASTGYFFEGLYLITHTTTTCTVAMAFAAGGGASATSIAYQVISSIASAANVAPVAPVMTYVNQISTTVVTATSTDGWVIRFQGILRTNAAGTWTPQVNWSANTTAPVMKVNSFIKFTPYGTNTNNILGNVG